MTGTLQPLDSKFAIVDRNGNPTDYFIRWAQQKQIDIGSSITLTDLANYLAAHPLIAGTGIQFTPDGNIADGVNIHADVQAILDEITATRGAILYRGLLGWAALLPDTAGKVLSTNGAGADPSWITPAAGGGGSFQFINQVVLGASAASIDFSAIPSTYENLVVEFMGRGSNASTTIIVSLRFNADSGANYDFYRYEMFHDPTAGSGMSFVESLAQTSLYLGQIPGSSAGASRAGAISVHLPNYARTTFFKKLRAQMASSLGVASFTEGLGWYDGEWRNAAAINEITLLPSAGNFVAGTIATLWGIKNS